MEWLHDKGLSVFYFWAFIGAVAVNFVAALWGWAANGKKLNLYAAIICAMIAIPGLMIFIFGIPLLLGRFYRGALKDAREWSDRPRNKTRTPLTRAV